MNKISDQPFEGDHHLAHAPLRAFGARWGLLRGRFHEPSFEHDSLRCRPGDCRAGLAASADEPISLWRAVHAAGCSVRTAEPGAATACMRRPSRTVPEPDA